ncbi:MAG: isoprenylcysteine carboxylmethyltransferase family protein [Paracoccus aminovorans]|nr:isoprenylcysteine carboxylmethyltransferase family protein [Paracoccus aminovorans]
MTMTLDQSPRVRPADQRLRIAVLRLLFLLALPLVLWTHSRWPVLPGAALRLAGTLCVFAAVLGRFWAILYIGGRKNAEVMRDGPYSICRHPLYLFSTLGVAGFGLMLQSLVLAALFGAAGFLVLSMTARREERYLLAQFGPAYAAYRAEVPMLWPAPRRFRSRPEVRFRIDVLQRNFADALVFLSALPLAEIVNQLHAHGRLLGIALP